MYSKMNENLVGKSLTNEQHFSKLKSAKCFPIQYRSVYTQLILCIMVHLPKFPPTQLSCYTIHVVPHDGYYLMDLITKIFKNHQLFSKIDFNITAYIVKIPTSFLKYCS